MAVSRSISAKDAGLSEKRLHPYADYDDYRKANRFAGCTPVKYSHRFGIGHRLPSRSAPVVNNGSCHLLGIGVRCGRASRTTKLRKISHDRLAIGHV